MQRCILCARFCETGTLRPGTPVRCNFHAWKALEPWETFTVEEARQEGIKRVSSLLRENPDEIKQEGLTAYDEIERWEEELEILEDLGELRQHYLDVIAAKKAYLSAFD